uniref:NADH-ubiquinone oxidoreductase chain 5 n=1 Tax=Halocynthia hilgendorfi ssp. n. KRK-2020 TaxID=2769794 RepID=A0A7G9XFL3_9ASCI|nr:NADH dehydrogenase subunit 5 [Halocynthia hilgendorfi ssp. n. KRK-2020]
MMSVIGFYLLLGFLVVLLLLQLLLVLLQMLGGGLGGFFNKLVVFMYKGVSGFLLVAVFFVFFFCGTGVGVVSVGLGWLGFSLEFLLDFYTCLFFLVGCVVSWSILEFSFGYMSGESGVGKFSWLLLLFLFFMMVLVISGNFLMLFIGWEGVGLLSFLLISWWMHRSEAVGSSLQAVIYNRVGDFGVMVWMFCMLMGGVGLFEGISFFMNLGFVFLFLGIVAKSSQFFFHPWLPNAMEGPTPVSSLLHSSTMVVAGVFLMIRVVSFCNVGWLVMLLGGVTAFWGGFCAVNQVDFKKVVAFSTTSQLGFMMFSVGLGFEVLAFLHMMVHAFFKALIFMVSGEVIHGSQNYQDLRKVNSAVMVDNTLGYLLMFSSFSMMGFPFLSGFVSKDILLECLFGGFLNRWVILLFFLSAVMTCIYSGVMISYLLVPLSFFGSKIGVGEYFMNGYFMYRVFIGAVVLGLFFLGWWFVYEEVYMYVFLKLVPLFVFFFGLVVGLFLVSLKMGKGVRGFGFFLGFYNPVTHKMWLGVNYVFSYLYLIFDHIVIEVLMPQGLVKGWRMYGKFLLLVVLMLGFLVFIFL